MKVLIVLLFVLTIPSRVTVEGEGWTAFSKVKFTERFYKEYNEYFLTPLFDSRIKSLEGKDVVLKGHYIPMDLEDTKAIIISKFPFSNCFFCGGAGPETVAEIHFSAKRPKLKADQILQVRGKLKLNNSDVNHMNFILEQATILN